MNYLSDPPMVPPLLAAAACRRRRRLRTAAHIQRRQRCNDHRTTNYMQAPACTHELGVDMHHKCGHQLTEAAAIRRATLHAKVLPI